MGGEFLYSAIESGAKVINLDLETQNKNGEKIHSISDNYFEIYCDITNEKNILKVANLIKEKFSYIDGLVNFVSINPQPDQISNTQLENMSIGQWIVDLNVGLTGAFLVLKYIGKIISENKNGGSIVLISSDLGIIAPDQRLYETNTPDTKDGKKPISYSAVKFGVIGLSKYVATYWAEKNVQVNMITPHGVWNNHEKSFENNFQKLSPMRRMSYNHEVASAVIYLLSDASSYVTGENMLVEGGWTVW